MKRRRPIRYALQWTEGETVHTKPVSHDVTAAIAIARMRAGIAGPGKRFAVIDTRDAVEVFAVEASKGRTYGDE